LNLAAGLGVIFLKREAGMETEKVSISVRPDRREGALVGYGLRATKPGVGDCVEAYLERSPRAKFLLAIAYPPSMRLGTSYRYGTTRKAALAAFEAFAVEALKPIDVSRTEIKNWSKSCSRLGQIQRRRAKLSWEQIHETHRNPQLGPSERRPGGHRDAARRRLTDAGAIETSWHRICTKDLNLLGSRGFTGNDLPLGVDMLYRTRGKYPGLTRRRSIRSRRRGLRRRSRMPWR
jgi:hypothetical protein